MAKAWSCRLGWHKWVRRSTEDGSKYRACAHCEKVDDRGPPAPGTMAGGF